MKLTGGSANRKYIRSRRDGGDGPLMNGNRIELIDPSKQSMQMGGRKRTIDVHLMELNEMTDINRNVLYLSGLLY